MAEVIRVLIQSYAVPHWLLADDNPDHDYLVYGKEFVKNYAFFPRTCCGYG